MFSALLGSKPRTYAQKHTACP